MKILHLDSGREMRGGQWQVLRLHRGLIARGHESLLLAREDSPLFAMARAEQLPCEAMRPLRLRTRGFDLLHAHDARSHSLAALLGTVPLVVSRRVAFPVRRSASSRWKYSRAQLFLAVSRHVSEELMRAGIEAERIEVVYDGVPLPAEASRGDIVIAPHSLDPEKGMALAQEAAKMAGIDLKLSSDLAADLPRARALVYLTHSEGLGSGVLLGMAHGVAVVASRVGGIPELIEDGVNGILVPNEAAAVAAAFRRITPAMGCAARATVQERFTEDHMIDATLAAYRKVVTCA